MSSLYGIPVHAVDAKATNTAGAAGRANNLGRKWNSLQIRATERAQGAAVPRSRKQRIRAGVQPPAEPAASSSLGGPLTLVTQYIEEDSDLGDILRAKEDKSQGEEEEAGRLGVVGLHTCGSLAAASIKLFFSTRSARFICNVGCCYHHLPEEFYTNPFVEEVDGQGTPGGRTL